MIDYGEFMVDKLKTFIEQDKDLSSIIPTNFDYETNKEEFNVFEEYPDTYQDEQLYPNIIVSIIQNNAREFSITNKEAETDVGFQISIQSMAVNYNGLKKPSTMCKIIAKKIGDYIENTLKFNRVGVSPLMPITTDGTNQIYSINLRYNAKHNLLLNLITRR